MVPAAFAAALEALSLRLDAPDGPPLAVALSGGSDSLALMWIAKAWADVAGRPLCALTVDHALHPDSASWTAAAGDAARRLGVPWRALVWTGLRPASGLPAAARTARHALLAEATRAAGARVLLLGHTADDVAESALIRMQTPTHGRLAQWSPSPAWPEGRGVFILRPLLSIRRADLRSWLAVRGAGWLDDPSNTDLRFARARARRVLAEAGPAGWPAGMAACTQAPPFPPLASTAARPWLATAETRPLNGALSFDAAALLAQPRAADTLARALACVSGRSGPPRGAAVHRLLDRLAVGAPITATLSGAKLSAAAGRVRLTRELGRAPPPPVPLPPGTVQVFDGRFELRALAPGWRVVPLSGHSRALPRPDHRALHDQPRDVRPSLPALMGPGGEVRLPQPFGDGPATTRCLVGPRLAAALGLPASESALEPAGSRGMPVAQSLRLSYLEADVRSSRPDGGS